MASKGMSQFETDFTNIWFRARWTLMARGREYPEPMCRNIRSKSRGYLPLDSRYRPHKDFHTGQAALQERFPSTVLTVTEFEN